MKEQLDVPEGEILGKYINDFKNVMRIEEYCKNDPVDYEKSGHEVISELETVLEKLKSM